MIWILQHVSSGEYDTRKIHVNSMQFSVVVVTVSIGEYDTREIHVNSMQFFVVAVNVWVHSAVAYADQRKLYRWKIHLNLVGQRLPHHGMSDHFYKHYRKIIMIWTISIDFSIFLLIK